MTRAFLLLIVICSFIVFTVPTNKTLSATLSPRVRSASCVKCGFDNDCRSCTAGGDATYCATLNCGACVESGECAGLELSQSGEGAISDAKLGWRERKSILAQEKTNSSTRGIASNIEVRGETVLSPNIESLIDVNTIKSIATKHPRFAATLANLYYAITRSQSYVVHWTPVEISPGDIEKFLNRNKNDDYFKRFDKRARQLNRLIQTAQLAEIVYSVTLENLNPYAHRIKIQVVNEFGRSSIDPAYSALEITITYSQTAAGTFTKHVSTAWQPSSLRKF